MCRSNNQLHKFRLACHSIRSSLDLVAEPMTEMLD